MNPAQLLAHFDRLVEAPDAIPRLRRFILDLAVRGKLVEQDSKDEPASELLDKISQAKKHLVAQEKLRITKELEPVTEGELLFDLPALWCRTRLGMVFDVRDGTHETPKYVETGYPLITSKNLSSGRLSFNDVKLISEQDHQQISERSMVERDDILLAMIGSIGNPVLVDTDRPFSIKNVALFKYYDRGLSCPGFLCLFLQYAAGKMRQLAAGGLQPFVSLGFLRTFPITLPPLAEQRRIVAKVDELMALCDRLEAAQARRERRRDRLAAASLNRLNRPDDGAKAFRAHACFHLCHLPRFTVRPDQIPALRQTVLNLAFCGRLVRQRANEGTGNLLLQRLNAAILKDRKVAGSRKKGQPTVDPMNCPPAFGTPASWAWSYLVFLCEQIADVDHNMPKAVQGGVPFISAKDLKDDGTIDFSDPKMISEDDYTRMARKVQIQRDDIVYSRIGARLGKARLVQVDTRFLISYSCCLIRPRYEFVDKNYIQRFLDSALALKQAHKGTQSIGVPDLGLGEIKAFRIPLSPLAEQRRIVAKVDELMAVCDRLESQLATAQTESRRLLEAILHEALAPAAALEAE